MPATYERELTLEKTPSYFVTKSVPARLHNMSSDVRLIVVVRDPVTRAISDYTQVFHVLYNNIMSSIFFSFFVILSMNLKLSCMP